MERTEQEKNQDSIILKIEEIYQSKNKEGQETGKKFISHLLRSYFPIGKCQKVIDIPEKPMKCAITGEKLFAFGEIWNAMQDKEYFKKMMLVSLNPEEKRENPFKDVANGRVLGLTGLKTDTYLCQDAYQALYNWFANKILSGDSHINWIMTDERKKSDISKIREILPEAEDQKKIDRAVQILKRPKRATMSLGDMSVLQELQEKLKLQEANGKQ